MQLSDIKQVSAPAWNLKSKNCLRRPGLHPGRKKDRRALPYNPLLPPRAREAGEIKLPLPPLRRLLAEAGSRVRSARDSVRRIVDPTSRGRGP